jgi:hypothetical protein
MAIFVEGRGRLIIKTTKSEVEADAGILIDGIALSPQEDKFATYGRTNSVVLWSISTGERLNVFQHNDSVNEIAFSADGHLLAFGILGKGSSGLGRPIYVWDINSGNLWCRLDGHKHQVHALAFDPQSRWLVSTSLDRTVRLWQLNHESPSDSREIWQLHYDDLQSDRIVVLSDGRIIVFRDKVLEVWREQQKQLEFSVPSHFGTRWYIDDNETCILGTFPQQEIRRWSLRTGEELQGYQNDIVKPEGVPGAALESSNQDIFRPVAGCYIWRTVAGNFTHVGFGPRGWVTPLMLSENGDSIVVPGRESAALIDLAPSQNLRILMPFTGKMQASCILQNQILMLNSLGELYISRDIA